MSERRVVDDIDSVATQKDRVTTEGRGSSGVAVVRGIIVTKKVADATALSPAPVVQRLSANRLTMKNLGRTG